MVGSCKRSKVSESDSKPVYKFECFKWTKLLATEDAAIRARSGHRIVCTDSSVFCVGGYNPELRRQLLCEVWEYNFLTRRWVKFKTENMPKELASCSVTLSGCLLFLYCGTGLPFGEVLNDSVYYCKLPKIGRNVTFEEVKTNSRIRPPAQYGHSVALVGNNLYTVGGTEGHVYSMDVYRLNIESGVWDKLYNSFLGDDGPKPRYRHEVAYFNNRLYVFGGGTSEYSFMLTEIPTFNLKTNQWEMLTTIKDEKVSEGYPGARKYHACVQDPYNPAIVFINGGTGGTEHYKDTWRINLNVMKWTRMSSMSLPYGIYFHSASVTPDGRMIIFGGTTHIQAHATRTADLFSAWVTIPKLSDMCWDALTFYVHQRVLPPPQDVQRLGLPLKYVNRVKNSHQIG